MIFFSCKCKVLCGESDNATKFVPVYGYYVAVMVVVIGLLIVKYY
jgi:hypothetical protein